jgi:hypothetical protein
VHLHDPILSAVDKLEQAEVCPEFPLRIAGIVTATGAAIQSLTPAPVIARMSVRGFHAHNNPIIAPARRLSSIIGKKALPVVNDADAWGFRPRMAHPEYIQETLIGSDTSLGDPADEWRGQRRSYSLKMRILIWSAIVASRASPVQNSSH